MGLFGFGKKGGKSFKDILLEDVEKLAPGQAVTREMHPTYGGGMVIVELNPEYPNKGKKYVMSTQGSEVGGAAGKAGAKVKFWESNKAKELAGWLAGRALGAFEEKEKKM